jgi:hypothetical protein
MKRRQNGKAHIRCTLELANNIQFIKDIYVRDIDATIQKYKLFTDNLSESPAKNQTDIQEGLSSSK